MKFFVGIEGYASLYRLHMRFVHLKWTKSETIGPNNKLHRNGWRHNPVRFYDNGADVIKRGDENGVMTVRLL